MLRESHTFEKIAAEIAGIDAMREDLRMKSFRLLEKQNIQLAERVLLMQGDRLRAARWMSMRHRVLDGRSPYEALAEGDLDRVLDLVAGA